MENDKSYEKQLNNLELSYKINNDYNDSYITSKKQIILEDNNTVNQNFNQIEDEIPKENVVIPPTYKPSQDEIYEKNLKIVYRYLGFHVPIFILSLIFFIFYFIGTSYIKFTETSYFSNIAKLWALGPIVSISEDCDNSSDNLLSDIWPGTQPGCDCSGIISVGICGKKQRLCQKLPQNNPLPMKIWKGKQICIKRMQSNYLNLDIVSNPRLCKNNKRSCGIIDSRNNYLCVDQNENCPINNIKLYYDDSYKPLNKNDYLLEISPIYSKNSTNATMVFSSKSSENKIPINFKTSTSRPCKNPYFENMNYTIYKLDFYNERQSCYETKSDTTKLSYETEYNEIDSMSKMTYYSENVVYDILKKLPGFSESELQMDISLYSRNYLGMSTVCLTDIKTKQLSDEIISELNKMIEFEEYTNSIGSLLSLNIFYFLLEFFILFTSTLPISKGIKSKKYSNTTKCDMWAYLFILIFVIIFSYIILKNNLRITEYLSQENYINEYFNDSRCIDNFTVNKFTEYLSNKNSAKIYFDIMIIIIFTNLIIHVS